MAFDFSRISVLLVEDAAFMRSLMVGVMRALGVERIHLAEDGQEAIDMMKVLAGNAEKTGFSPVDMIVSDVEMPNVDGLMFLRWLRRHEQSPDRFIPVVMTDVADSAIVGKARDAGVTEFVVKPFSVEGLAARMANVIEFPRQYVYNPTYFGPDRRRHEPTEIEDDKRKLGDDDVNIIYSGKTPDADKEGVKVWLFRQQNRLLERMGGKSAAEGGSIDPDMLKAAREQVVEMEEDYADWVASSITKLEQTHNRIVENIADAPRQLDAMRVVARELRGQGGTFGYPLMTHFGRSLEEIASEDVRATEQLVELISAHIDGIKVVMREHIKGDGGEIGAELLKGLEEAKKKHATSEAV